MGLPASKKPSGITLFELLTALILFSMIVLAFASIDTFSHEHVITSDRRTQLQNDLSLALDHMAKRLQLAIGDCDNWPVSKFADGKGFWIRIDDNADGLRGTGDKYVGYHQEDSPAAPLKAGLQFYYDCSAPGTCAKVETIATRLRLSTDTSPGLVLNGQFDASTPANLTSNVLGIVLNGIYDYGQTASRLNPALTVETNIYMPAVSSDLTIGDNNPDYDPWT